MVSLFMFLIILNPLYTSALLRTQSISFLCACSNSAASRKYCRAFTSSSTQRRQQRQYTSRLLLSDWSNFSALDDDDDIVSGTNSLKYASENDPQELKAQIGSNLPAPEILGDHVDPIFVPQGSVMELSIDNVQGVLAACRQEIGTMFGYSEENRGVGITGGVDFIDLDGPNVVVSLKGRFWHQRTTVLARVGAYIKGRIPEVVDVVIDDPYQLTDEANNLAL